MFKVMRRKMTGVHAINCTRRGNVDGQPEPPWLRLKIMNFFIEKLGLTDEQLLDAIRDQLQDKFGSKGARVVEDNMRVVKRGFDEIQEVVAGPLTEGSLAGEGAGSEPPIPMMVKPLPQSQAPMTDIHRFWEQTGNFYARGMGNDNLTDPFIGLGVMPACTALSRMS